MDAFSLNQRQELDHVGDGPLLQFTHNRVVRVVCETRPARRQWQVWEFFA